MEIRPATLNDLNLVATALEKGLVTLEAFGHEVPATAENIDFIVENILLLELGTLRHGILLAFDGDKFAGAIITTAERTPIKGLPTRAICYMAWVEPEYRKQGLAYDLLRQSNARLKSLGFTQVVSHVSMKNDASLALCWKAGAVPTQYRVQFPL